jgi:hypothetical protein
VKGHEYAVFGGMYIGFYIPITHVNRALKRNHRIFRLINGAATMRKGDDCALL